MDTLGTRTSVNIVYKTGSLDTLGTKTSVNIVYKKGSLDTLGTKTSVNIVNKTMFLLKISQNIYILPTWVSTVSNQLVDKAKKCIKTTPPYEFQFFIFHEKASHSNPGKTIQGMTRHGLARPDEARRGGAQTRRCPLVFKNTVCQHTAGSQSGKTS